MKHAENSFCTFTEKNFQHVLLLQVIFTRRPLWLLQPVIDDGAYLVGELVIVAGWLDEGDTPHLYGLC